MRKFIKNQIVDLIETIASGIKYAISKREEANIAYNMLVDCYEGVESIGERLRNNISDNEELISCENAIILIKENLEILNDILATNQEYNEIYDKLSNEFDLLKKIVEKEKITVEVLFLPYKASMWDSLESIWLAAKEDENCEAYVMPIPYFEKNPDGSFGKMHYEGYDFPENVPVIDWKSYSLENRMPDIVYVHNPYDEYNFVTSIHPDYYSRNLKKYTNTLVYVPYFSNSGGVSDVQGNLPTYINFDYIVVQSEGHKNFYQSELIKDKLLPLGSPKFDRVINMCKNPPEPPKEWKERIKGKKVYFYNTSIGALLKNPRVFLNKMKYVFETFENREDVVLLWRPHPLFESTLKSMRPQFFEYYLKLKRYFVKANIGILDTTSDITRTIALSDAYLGNTDSSVLSLFGISGKEIYLLNNWSCKLPEEEELTGKVIPFVYNSLEAIVSIDNKLFTTNIEDETLKCEFRCNISEYSFDGFYVDVKKIGNKFYLCPGYEQEIGIFENGVLRKIPLKSHNRVAISFSQIFAYDKYIVLVPISYPAIVRFDTQTEKVEYFTDKITAFMEKVDGEMVAGGAVVRGNHLFIASPANSLVLVFDILTGKVQVLTTGAKQQGCCAICDDGKDLWLMPFKGKTIVRWNPLTGKMQEYDNLPEDLKCVDPYSEIEQEKYIFKSAISIDDYVLFAPWWGNMFVKLNKNTGEITEWVPPVPIQYLLYNAYLNNKGHAQIIKENQDNEIFLISYDNKAIYKVDFEENRCGRIDIEVDIEVLKNSTFGFGIASKWLGYACLENAFNTLKDFLDGNITGNQFNKEKQFENYSGVAINLDGTCGKKVHELIMKKFFELKL